jgi:D-alanine-D-alanine ligase
VPTEPARNGRADDQPCTNPVEGRPAASHGSLVDGHVGRYAARARDMAASEIRALFAVATRPEIVLGRVVATLGLPLFVKPARGASALGGTLVRAVEDLPAAMIRCFAFDDTALIEECILGTEVAVGVIDLGGGPEALPPVEICPRGGSYDYAALGRGGGARASRGWGGGARASRGWGGGARASRVRGGGARTSTYTPGQAEFHVPARLSPAESRAVTEAAVTAHHALGLRDVSRTDLISSAGQAFFLEVSVVPGMTETSALPMALDAAGRSLGAVCRDLLGQAAARGT